MSRIGKKPIALPKGVTVTIAAGAVEVKGPKGSLRQAVPPGVLFAKDGDALVAKLERELEPYDSTRGMIRFPLSAPVPVRLIARIARFRAAQIRARDKGTGAKTGREAQLKRVRRLCATLPSVFEKISHGTPTFFVEKDKRVFAMFADNHHQDGHLALWVPVKNGLQPLLIEDAPATYYKPPYVGSSGWVGIELAQIRDDALQEHLREAWDIVGGKRHARRAR
jgi:hypothetical protein